MAALRKIIPVTEFQVDPVIFFSWNTILIGKNDWETNGNYWKWMLDKGILKMNKVRLPLQGKELRVCVAYDELGAFFKTLDIWIICSHNNPK